MLFCDIIYTVALFIYALMAFTKLFYIARHRQHYEFQRQKVFMALNGFGVLVSIPMNVIDLLYWIIDYEALQQNRVLYYVYFWPRILPAILYISTRTNEDCFDCRFIYLLCYRCETLLQHVNLDLIVLNVEMNLSIVAMSIEHRASLTRYGIAVFSPSTHEHLTQMTVFRHQLVCFCLS